MKVSKYVLLVACFAVFMLVAAADGGHRVKHFQNISKKGKTHGRVKTVKTVVKHKAHYDKIVKQKVKRLPAKKSNWPGSCGCGGNCCGCSCGCSTYYVW